MLGVILFDLYKGLFKRTITNSVLLVIGTGLLWVLCAAKLEFVAYGLLTLPVIFMAFLLAVIVFDQSLFKVSHEYDWSNSSSSSKNNSWYSMDSWSNGTTCGESCDTQSDGDDAEKCS
jgi:hypothetical protein